MKKDFLIVLSVIFIGIFLFKGTKIQSVDDYYLTNIDNITPDSEVVTISINAKTARDNWEKLDKGLQQAEYVPENGMILEKQEVVLRPNDNVLELLKRMTRHNKIPFDFQGSTDNSFGSAYIKGINHLYEFSAGPLSGWMYKINDEFLNYGVSKYYPKDNDEIEIIYTTDLGRDIGGEMPNDIKK